MLLYYKTEKHMPNTNKNTNSLILSKDPVLERVIKAHSTNSFDNCVIVYKDDSLYGKDIKELQLPESTSSKYRVLLNTKKNTLAVLALPESTEHQKMISDNVILKRIIKNFLEDNLDDCIIAYKDTVKESEEKELLLPDSVPCRISVNTTTKMLSIIPEATQELVASMKKVEKGIDATALINQGVFSNKAPDAQLVEAHSDLIQHLEYSR